MNSREYDKEQLLTNGFAVTNAVFTPEEPD
jgi:hypothetical protein